MPKTKLILIFGGQNRENAVSILSTNSVFVNLDKSKYQIRLIYITADGSWHAIQDLNSSFDPSLFDHLEDEFLDLIGVLKSKEWLVFSVIHGKKGEDGTLQGLFEIMGVKYVGSGVLASAVGMDKEIAKKLFAAAGLQTARSICVRITDPIQIKIEEITQNFNFPIFIKPAREGSSVGVSKVYNSQELDSVIKKTFEFDSKILVEEFINGREIECAVLGNDHPMTSVVGELSITSEFYSYDSKYTDGKASLIIPANIDEVVAAQIRSQAVTAFQALNCQGLARVDFFLTDNKQIYINEINTMPGFTVFSMYPKLWEAAGLTYTHLLDKIIELAGD